MTTRTSLLKQAVKDRILVLDGAMGTMLQRYKLTEADYRGEAFATWPSDLKGNHDLLNITRPDVVAEVHRDYFLAGADIVETNTFNANAISQADYGTQSYVYEINLAAARLARKVADEFTAAARPRAPLGMQQPAAPARTYEDFDTPSVLKRQQPPAPAAPAKPATEAAKSDFLNIPSFLRRQQSE